MVARLAKIAGVVAAVVVVAAAVLVSVVLVRWDRTFDAPYPDIHASSDPKVIEAGRYLAYGPAHCAACHGDPAAMKDYKPGTYPPLVGGTQFDIPPGNFRAPNITPDPETGIGKLTDAELARFIRYGVRPDGRAALPFMEYQNLSDEDLTALISFLRSQAPVRHVVPQHDIHFLGKAVLAFLIKPQGPAATPAKRSPVGPSVERGQYLAMEVAQCGSCHTKRSMVDGHYENARFSGGTTFDVEGAPTQMLVTPNLTPDRKTGRIAEWSEDRFVGRFRAGEGVKGTHMPWRLFSSMTDDDLRSIYRYLHSLRPVEHATGPSLQKKTS